MQILPTRKATHALIASIASAVGFLNLPPVYPMLLKGAASLSQHPRTSSIGAAVVVILSLLHDPQVRDYLGLKRTIVQEEVVPIAEDSKP